MEITMGILIFAVKFLFFCILWGTILMLLAEAEKERRKEEKEDKVNGYEDQINTSRREL